MFPRKQRWTALPCFYCGVDSGPVVGFFIWIIGLGLLSFLCFLIWGRLTGKFISDDKAGRIPLEKEEG